MQGTWEDGVFVLASTKDDKIARLEATISRLRDENKAAWDSAEYNARRARMAEAAIKRLLDFTEHDAECQGQPGYDIPCSCGYDELMKELEETK